MKTGMAFLLVMAVLIAASAVSSTAQTPAKAGFNGQALYEDYCAVCHGRDGKGDGPAARALKSPPADLTQLSHSHSGRFPETAVRKMILGQDMMPSHGTEAMPIWGQVFAKIDPATAGPRVDALIAHLQKLQAK